MWVCYGVCVIDSQNWSQWILLQNYYIHPSRRLFALAVAFITTVVSCFVCEYMKPSCFVKAGASTGSLSRLCCLLMAKKARYYCNYSIALFSSILSVSLVYVLEMGLYSVGASTESNMTCEVLYFCTFSCMPVSLGITKNLLVEVW